MAQRHAALLEGRPGCGEVKQHRHQPVDELGGQEAGCADPGNQQQASQCRQQGAAVLGHQKQPHAPGSQQGLVEQLTHRFTDRAEHQHPGGLQSREEGRAKEEGEHPAVDQQKTNQAD